MKYILALLLFLSLSNVGYGQTKIEQEFRIDADEVPENALNFVKSLNFNRKIKWYKEVNGEKTSIEAKTKYRKQRHSIEFSKDGILEDVEVKIKWCDLPKATRTSIITLLEDKYLKFSIEKVQMQYVEQKGFLKFHHREEEKKNIPKPNYELIVEGKANATYQLYEYLFSSAGELMKNTKIIVENSHNLEY